MQTILPEKILCTLSNYQLQSGKERSLTLCSLWAISCLDKVPPCHLQRHFLVYAGMRELSVA